MRIARPIAEIAAKDPRFAVMAEYGRSGVARRRPSAAPRTAILPDPAQPHNRLASVRAIDPASLDSQIGAPAKPVEGVEVVQLMVSPAPTTASLH